MRISTLEIRNFKAIRSFCANNLSDVILIAGPNGCGKSCVFDAIRLLKSMYGGYKQPHEWQSFFNEFQVNMENADEIRRLFCDVKKPIIIAAEFMLALEEQSFLRSNAESIIYEDLRRKHMSRRETISLRVDGLGADAQDAFQQISKIAKERSTVVTEAVLNCPYSARLVVHPDLRFDVEPNPVLQLAFGIYDPKNLGIIDFHGPSRTYNRERIGGIKVNIQESADRMAQHALYNWQNKYTNIKSELAAAYVRDLFVERAGGKEANVPSIIETLKELFNTFLPGKTFHGPRPEKEGLLTFPVVLDGGAEHDIDDLSSGEKELVYGYLRLRNVSPRNSMILLDEPELHLNPRIVRGLPEFYRQHLGIDLGNQLWMATHSDAFLRDAFRSGGFSILHMTQPTVAGVDENQAVSVSAANQVDRAIMDLVGDIAGYRPGSKIVVFESSQSASFDSLVTTRLFPSFADQINALSGGSKSTVRQMYAALEKAASQMEWPIRVYAIVDRDTDAEAARSQHTRVFAWNVYHIENYLLEPQFIRKVLQDNPHFCKDMHEDAISEELKCCAIETKSELVAHELRAYVHRHIKECLDLGFDPMVEDTAAGLSEAISRVGRRFGEKEVLALSQAEVRRQSDQIEGRITEALDDGSWRSDLRGRDILRRFAGKHLRGLPYEAFRDAVLARMGDAGFQPIGMRDVIDQILKD